MAYSFWLILLSLSLLTQSFAYGSSPTVLLIFDGFRHDYISTYDTPNLDQLVAEGTFAPRVQPEFPAATLPNLASLFTGRHTEGHGVLDLDVFDSDAEAAFNASSKEFWKPTRDIGTIFDLLARKAEHTKSAVIGWPTIKFLVENTETSKQQTEEKESSKDDDAILRFNQTNDETVAANEKPSITDLQHEGSDRVTNNNNDDENETTEEQTKNIAAIEDYLESALVQLRDPATAVDLLVIYSDHIATAAQVFGPDSDKVGDEIAKVDAFLGKLLEAMQEVDYLKDNVNVLVTSVSAFAPVLAANVVQLDDLIEPKLYEFYGSSPIYNIRPISKSLAVFNALQRGTLTKAYSVYIKDGLPDQGGIPDNWNYKHSQRVQEIVLVADEGFVFAADFAQKMQGWKDKRRNETDDTVNDNVNDSDLTTFGCSGYLSNFDSMQTLLIANGPAFSAGITLSTEADQAPHTVDIFALLCNLLEVELPKTANGTLMVFQQGLKSSPLITIEHVVSYVKGHIATTVAVCIAGVLILLSISLILIVRKRRRNMEADQGYRYSKVRNRRLSGGPMEPDLSVDFDSGEDHRSLLGCSGGGSSVMEEEA